MSKSKRGSILNCSFDFSTCNVSCIKDVNTFLIVTKLFSLPRVSSLEQSFQAIPSNFLTSARTFSKCSLQKPLAQPEKIFSSFHSTVFLPLSRKNTAAKCCCEEVKLSWLNRNSQSLPFCLAKVYSGTII